MNFAPFCVSLAISLHLLGQQATADGEEHAALLAGKRHSLIAYAGKSVNSDGQILCTLRA